MLSLNRREFLRRCAVVGAAAGCAVVDHSHAQAAEPLVHGTPNADKLGWRLGFSAYTFRALTAMETLDKIADVGLHYAELFSWQKFSPMHLDTQVGPQLPRNLRSDLKKKASDCGVELIACFTTMADAEAAKTFFPYAADMGFEVIVSEPPESLLDTVEDLTAEYKIDLALHNHPKPSHYWNPEIGSAALHGRSERMGFCCDTGHWCRSGLDPVAMLVKVAKRAKTFHLKDLDQCGEPDAKDVIWGQGKGRIAELLAEVAKQGMDRPYFGIEWERNLQEPLQTHTQSIAFFERVASQIVGS